jgi:hypothetical protein
MEMEKEYQYLIGKFINKYEETDNEIKFFTDDEEIAIQKFIPYCACNVGEYIDNITYEGKISGVITGINANITEDPGDGDYDVVYEGTVSILFDYAKINMLVHGEDNGYYGVAFEMPVTIKKLR